MDVCMTLIELKGVNSLIHIIKLINSERLVSQIWEEG